MTFSPLLTVETSDLPPFIEAVYGGAPEQFNFWSPVRLGDPRHDYLAGARHFQTALSFAHASQMVDLLMHVVSHMCQVGVGSIERGFIDALSAKATYGARPEPLAETIIQSYQDALAQPAEAVRAGEAKALAFLDLARERRAPEILQQLLVEIVNRKSERLGAGILPFLHIVSSAAYRGAAN